MKKYVFLAFTVLILISSASACLAGYYPDPGDHDDRPVDENGYAIAGVTFFIGMFLGFAAGDSYGRSGRKPKDLE